MQAVVAGFLGLVRDNSILLVYSVSCAAEHWYYYSAIWLSSMHNGSLIHFFVMFWILSLEVVFAFLLPHLLYFPCSWISPLFRTIPFHIQPCFLLSVYLFGNCQKFCTMCEHWNHTAVEKPWLQVLIYTTLCVYFHHLSEHGLHHYNFLLCFIVHVASAINLLPRYTTLSMMSV